jgi:hypothetical protein
VLTGALQRIRASRYVARDRPLETLADVIWWWESRRLAFNLLVGATGILTCIGLGIVLGIGIQFPQVADADFLLPDPPLFAAIFGILGFGIAANICYTGGWIVELLVRCTWPDESDRLATLTFTLGLLVAVCVTLLPIPLFAMLTLLIALFS